MKKCFLCKQLKPDVRKVFVKGYSIKHRVCKECRSKLPYLERRKYPFILTIKPDPNATYGYCSSCEKAIPYKESRNSCWYKKRLYCGNCWQGSPMQKELIALLEGKE